MKYRSTTIASLLIILSNCFIGHVAAADKPETQATGIIHHGKETLDSFQGNGRVTFEGTTVKNHAQVNGSLFAHKAILGTLDVGGHAHLRKSSVAGKTRISGFLTAEKTNFRNRIVLTGQKLTLQNCKVGSIHIKKTNWPFSSQVVELSKNSVCKGKIVFDSGKGRVVVKDGSKILGKVRGAVIEKDQQKK